jgi:phosphoglycerate dehydrogenase-like enzyme
LDELFRRADAISLHTPDFPVSPGTVRGSHFANTKPGAILVNTARGGLVQEEEMLMALAARPDVMVVLDPKPEEQSRSHSLLLTMPNVILTPQLTIGRHEDQRWMGRCMIEEYLRWSSGQPLLWEITKGGVVCRS